MKAFVVMTFALFGFASSVFAWSAEHRRFLPLTEKWVQNAIYDKYGVVPETTITDAQYVVKVKASFFYKGTSCKTEGLVEVNEVPADMEERFVTARWPSPVFCEAE